MGTAELPPPVPQPNAFLMSVAPVLELDQERLARMDSQAIDNVYDLVDGLVDCIRPEDDNKADQPFFNLVKTVIHAHKDGKDLVKVLRSEAYTFEVKDLPVIVQSVTAWLCEHLVDIVAVVKEQARLPGRRVRPGKASKPKPRSRPKAASRQPAANPTKKEAAQSSPADKPTRLAEEELYPYPFTYRRGANGKAELLRADEEVMLAKIIEAGVFAEERLQQIGPITESMSAEEIQLRQDLQTIVSEGKKASSFFVEANIRLAGEIATHYLGFGLAYRDLVQVGALGLMHAVEMFDYAKGYKFSSYSTHWIRQALSRTTMQQGRIIALPIHTHAELSKLNRTRQELEADLGRHPTNDELSAESGLSLDKILLLQEAGKKAVSLDLPVGRQDGGEFTLKDKIRKYDDSDIVTDLINDMENRALRRTVQTVLTPRERLILEAYIEESSLYDIADLLELPLNTVRTAAKRVLAKLAHPSADLPSAVDLASIGNWRQEAHCKDGGDVDFFPLSGGIYFEEAKFICGLCPVARQCLEYAQSRDIEYGMWGGVSEEERQAMHRHSARIRYVRQKEDEHLNAS